MVVFLSACSADKVSGPAVQPATKAVAVAGGDTAVSVQMIGTTCEAIGSCEPDQLPVAMVYSQSTLPVEAIGDPLFYTAGDEQADGPCDATRNAQLSAWWDLVWISYTSGAAVIGTTTLTGLSAGALLPVQIFVSAGAATAITKASSAFYGAAKENQLCRLRNRLYPYNRDGAQPYWP
jgi:hypothetical protein